MAPAVVDGTVYVGSSDDNMYALDASTGNERWSFSTGDSVFSSPAVVDGTVYFGSDDYDLYAVTEGLPPEVGPLVTEYPGNKSYAERGESVTLNVTAVDSSPGVRNVSIDVSAINRTGRVNKSSTGGGPFWRFDVVVDNATQGNFSLPVTSYDRGGVVNDTESIEVQVVRVEQVDNYTYQYRTNVSAGEEMNVSHPSTQVENETSTDFTRLTLTPEVNISVNLTVKTQTDPGIVPSPSEEAVSYLNVTHPELGNDNVSNVTHRFEVEKSRLDDLNAGPGDAVMQRYSGGSWNDLETSKVGEAGDVYRFEARAPGLSMMAVVVDAETVEHQEQTSDTTNAPPAAEYPFPIPDETTGELHREFTAQIFEPGEEVEVEFDTDAVVEEIRFTSSEEFIDPTFETAQYEERPEGVSELDREPFSHVALTSSIPGEDVESLALRARVPGEWISNSGVGPSALGIKRWSSSEDGWKELDTSVESEKEGEVVVLEAEAGELSVFAIGTIGSSEPDQTPDQSGEPSKEGTANSTADPVSGSNEEEGKTDDDGEPDTRSGVQSKDVPGFVAPIAVISILMAIMAKEQNNSR